MKCKKKVNYFLIVLAFVVMVTAIVPPQKPKAFGLTGASVALLGSMFPYVAGGVLIVAGVTMAVHEYKEYKKQKLVEAMENFTADEIEDVNSWSAEQSETEVDTSKLRSSVIQKMKDSITSDKIPSNYVDDSMSNTQFEQLAKGYIDKKVSVIENKVWTNSSTKFISVTSTFIKKAKGSYYVGSYRDSIDLSSSGKDCFLYQIQAKIEAWRNCTISYYCWFIEDKGVIKSLPVENENSTKYYDYYNTNIEAHWYNSDFLRATELPGFNVMRSRTLDNLRTNEADNSICIPHKFNPAETERAIDSAQDVTAPARGAREMDRDKVFEVPFSKDKVKERERIGDGTIEKPTDDPIDHPTDEPTNPVLSWEWLKDLLREILDAIKSIPSLLRDVLAGIRAIPSILQDMLDWIKGIPARWNAFWSINWTEVFAHAQYGDILKVKFKPFYDTVGILSSIKANPQSHSGKFYMKIPKEMGGNGQEQCVLDLSFGDSYFKIARNITKAGMWVAFLFWIIKIFKPKFTIGG